MSKRMKKSGKSNAAAPRRIRKVRPWEWAVIAGAAAAAAWFGWEWRRAGNAEAEFLELARSGETAIADLGAVRSAGGGHLAPGQYVSYEDRFPTSGVHDPKWVDPGVYDTAQLPTKLVHSLEHGMVVIYYDAPSPETMDLLEEWASLYRGGWSGVVVTPAPGIGQGIILTAWNQKLPLDPFDAEAAAAFVDRFRGRGPENPVR